MELLLTFQKLHSPAVEILGVLHFPGHPSLHPTFEKKCIFINRVYDLYGHTLAQELLPRGF